MATSPVITNILRRLKAVETKAKLAGANKQTAWNVLQNGVASGPFATDDQSDAVNDVIDRIVNTGHGGRIFLPSSIYTVNDGLVIPENVALVVEGETQGWRSNFGRGTMLKRRANPSVADQPMIECLGSDSDDSHRALAGFRRLYLDGGYVDGVSGVTDTGEGITIQRGQEGPLEDVRFANFAGTAFRANQVFNAEWRGLRTTNCGNSTDAAVHIGATGSPAPGGTVTLNIFGIQQEQNRGVDLRITGNPVGGGPSTEINVLGGKWEGGLGVAQPYHHHEFSELNTLTAGVIFSHRSVPVILVEHLQTGDGEDRMVQYRGYRIEQAPSIASPDYFIDVQGGALDYEGMIRGDANVADVRIGANVRPGAVSIDAKCFTKATGGGRRALTIDDQRTNPEF